MKRLTGILLIVLLVFSLSAAMAQRVECATGGFSVKLPDHFVEEAVSGDPDLCLLLQDENISLSVYVSDAGGLLPDAFEVFTGDETESGTVVFGGVEMTYVAGQSSEGNYRIYTWLDRRNQVQFYFLITANRKASRKTIDSVMNSLEFE